MNPVRLLIVLVAAVSAIGLAVVMQRAMGGKPAAAPSSVVAPVAGKPMTQVLVAKRDLAIGDRLTGDDVTWQAWPTEAVNAAFITNGTQTGTIADAEFARFFFGIWLSVHTSEPRLREALLARAAP